MPGPIPKHPSQRRRTNPPLANVKLLPSEGRQGNPPPWPLPNPAEDELTVWTEAWRTPMAVEWEKLSWTRPIARYVRQVVRAEAPDVAAATLAEVRQLEDRFGLTHMSMLRLRCRRQE